MSARCPPLSLAVPRLSPAGFRLVRLILEQFSRDTSSRIQAPFRVQTVWRAAQGPDGMRVGDAHLRRPEEEGRNRGQGEEEEEDSESCTKEAPDAK